MYFLLWRKQTATYRIFFAWRASLAASWNCSPTRYVITHPSAICLVCPPLCKISDDQTNGSRSIISFHTSWTVPVEIHVSLNRKRLFCSDDQLALACMENTVSANWLEVIFGTIFAMQCQHPTQPESYHTLSFIVSEIHVRFFIYS